MKLKLTKVKNEKMLLVDLHKAIYDNTNALISLETDRLCRKFIKDLQKIPLSEELQSN